MRGARGLREGWGGRAEAPAAAAVLRRVLTITAIAQLFVLGSTWVFGLFLFDPHSQVLSYTFTILNCLQGLFLFVLLCLLNKKVGGAPGPRGGGGGRPLP